MDYVHGCAKTVAEDQDDLTAQRAGREAVATLRLAVATPSPTNTAKQAGLGRTTFLREMARAGAKWLP